MEPADWVANRFEAERDRLVALAYRMLGSRADAEDAVQESWMRLTRAEPASVENLGGWLTTVVSRVCLDQLRSRRVRDHDALEPDALEDASPASHPGPEHEVVMAESVGLAMLVVLERLDPAERVAFVLHDMFAIPFEQIGVILDRSPAAVRQLASRARRRVQGAEVPAGSVDRHGELVSAFLAASRSGDFEGLLSVLDVDVVLRVDAAALAMSEARQGHGAPELSPEVRGPVVVAETFKGRAAAAQPALIDGAAGAAWAPARQPRVLFRFTTVGDKITAIELIADPATISGC